MTEAEPAAEAEGDEVTALTKALAEEREKAENYLANWQRTQADFANYKRRSDQERMETSKYASVQLMLTILPALDDLERAFESITPDLADDGWVEGIRLIGRKLRAGLEAQGLSEIQALGEAFNPNLHEAAMHSKGEEGIIVQELQKGYMLHDRVIRPSMVVIGNGEEEEEDE